MPEKNLVTIIDEHFRSQPDHPAQVHKQSGRWQTVTYGQLGQATTEIAAGLISLGIEKGDRVSILSQNSIEWAQADLGMLFAGCTTVTIYPNSIHREVKYILENSDSRVVFVENADQLEKVLKVRSDCPALEQAVLIFGEKGSADFAMTLDELREQGRKLLAQTPDLVSERLAETTGHDVAAIIYTSGTTGPPKGVMLTHDNILFVIHTSMEMLGDSSDVEINLSFLPLSHALERIGGHFLMLIQGKTIGYAQSLETIAENFREVRPQFATAVPRVFEKVYARIQDQLLSATPAKRKIFRWALGVGKKTIVYRQAEISYPLGLAIKAKIADWLVFRKLRDVLGGRLKYFISGGAPLDPKIAEFFWSVGILVLEAWGATETAAPATVNMPYAFKLGSVGKPMNHVEVKVEPDGELLVRGPNICKGYWKMPEQSDETFDEQGWYHSGDVGRIDKDGFVYITDRKKELIITAAGKNISPQNIENKLKLSPFVSNAMTFGDKKKFVTALITLDVDAMCKKLGLDGATHDDLAKRDDVRELIEKEVAKVNDDLPRFEQIKYFRLPEEDFSVEQDELSPSLKLKRRNIIARYGELIESMYADV